MSKKQYNEEDFSGISDMLEGKHHVIPIVSNEDEEEAENTEVPDTLPILTLRSSVLFPGSITPITVGRQRSMKLIRDVEAAGGLMGAVLQKEPEVEQPGPDDLYRVGTAARIIKILEMPNGNLTVILHGLEKVEIKEYITAEPYFKASVAPLKDSVPERSNIEFEALVDSIKDVALEHHQRFAERCPRRRPSRSRTSTASAASSTSSARTSTCPTPTASGCWRPRACWPARRLLEILIREQQLVEFKSEIQTKVKQDIDKQQRDYFLQQQMRTIQDELGDGADADIEKMREEAKKKNWPKEVGETFEKELQKVERLNPAVAEYSVQMTYLQLLLELPWNDVTKDNLDLTCAREQLDRDHFGLDEVKERLLEHLAVIKLKGDLKSPILCLYGPPGVGKTSLGKSVAAALGRKFGRISLGGLHDESEIRGHRRTYIGAMPGRIIQTIKRGGSSNPVIILDEVDKVTVSNHGDPSSALLEVLDPEQNTTFHDNYIDTEYDLSKVLFIATANNIGNIAPALRDRMEMINIAGLPPGGQGAASHCKHLVPKQLEAHGVPAKDLKIAPKVIEKVIADYTRESGVRSLDKQIAKIVRTRAKNIGFGEEFKPEVSPADVERILGMPKFLKEEYEVGGMTGVVTGLAWTEVGGDILYIESVLTPGKGALTMTGNLGDVMKESATIALQWVKAHTRNWASTPKSSKRTTSTSTFPRARSPRTARGRHHDDDFAGFDPLGPPRKGLHRDDGRDDAPRAGDARRRRQGEDPGRETRGDQGDRPLGREPQRHQRDQAGIPRRAHVPLREDQRRRAEARDGRIAATVRGRPRFPVRPAGRGQPDKPIRPFNRHNSHQ